MVTIFDQFGRPIQRPEKRPDRRPLAAAPLSDKYREYVADGLTPGRLAAVLKEADLGSLTRQAELFDQIEEKDGHILGDISKRRNVILDAEFTLSPASEDKEDVRIYEDVKEMLAGIDDWPDVQESMQDAIGKGFSAIDLDWDVSEGQARVQKFEFIEQKRFRFVDKDGVFSTVPMLITEANPLGEEIPAWRIMMHRYGGKSGHAARSGIYRICAWWYLFKNYAVKDWVIFCEVYGMPLRLGKYNPGASVEDKEALEIAIRTLGHDAAGIISKATEIEFVTGSNGTVSTDLYKDLAGFGNKEMSKAILGGTLTTDVDGKGSYAASNTHNDVRCDLIRADARAQAATVRSQLIRPYVGFNYGWDAKVPLYEGNFVKEDLEAHAEMIDRFADRMDVPVSYVRKKFSIPGPEKGEEVLRPKTTQNFAASQDGPLYTGAAPNVTKPARTDFLAWISNDLESRSDDYIESLLEPVKKLMAECRTLEEFRDRILDAFSDMDPESLGTLIEQAMTVADLGGRYEVDNS